MSCAFSVALFISFISMPTRDNSDVTKESQVSFGFLLGILTECWLSINACLAGVSAGSWSRCPVKFSLRHFISLLHSFLLVVLIEVFI